MHRIPPWELVATAAERNNRRWERPTLALERERFIRFLSSVHVNRIGLGQQRLSRTILDQIGLMQNDSVYFSGPKREFSSVRWLKRVFSGHKEPIVNKHFGAYARHPQTWPSPAGRCRSNMRRGQKTDAADER
jgi:hypothetical protein